MHRNEPEHFEQAALETRDCLDNVGQRSAPQNFTNDQPSRLPRLLAGTVRQPGDVQERHDDARVVDAYPTAAASGIDGKGRETPSEIVNLRRDSGRPRTAL